MSNSSTITLSDGRKLGFAEYGSSDGKPLLLFHGAPGSRLECHPDQSILKELGVRLIVIDRPGYGVSDSTPERSILSWADDVRQLMDSLEVGCCPIIGFSGGGPYAMACAYTLPERVSRLGLVSSLAPFNNPNGTDGMNEQSRSLYALALADPDMFKSQITALVTNGEVLFHIITASLPEEDQRVLSRADMYEMYHADMNAAVNLGVSGIVSDMLLYASDWGFKLGDIQCETHLWQGMKDINVPPSMGQYLAESIRNCRATFLADEAHYLLFKYWKDILTELTE